MAFELFKQSVLGASHVRKNTPCEDYGLKQVGGPNGEYMVFAVADGHGDNNCTRSQIGSRLVCEIARNALLDFAESVDSEKCADLFLEAVAATPNKEGVVAFTGVGDRYDLTHAEGQTDTLIKNLIRYIAGKWIEVVSLELSDNPMTEEELAGATEYGADYQRGIRVERMYGTTLMAGLLTEKYLLLLHQGDGRIVVFGEDGKAFQPVPWDDRCVGTATTSMCDPDAAQSFRYCIIDLQKTPVIACVLGSDGVEDSFPSSMEKTHSYYRELLKYACENGIDALEEYLKEELSTLSRERSQDDVTVSGFLDIAQVSKFLPAFEEQNRIVDVEDEVAIWEEKVRSVESGGKYQHLLAKLKAAEARLEQVRATYKAKEQECAALETKIKEEEEVFDLHSPEVEELLEEAVDYMPPEKKNKLTNVITALLGFVTKSDSKKDRLQALIRDLAQKKAELEALNADIEQATEAAIAAKTEFEPVEERYNGFKQSLEEARKKLNELKGTSSEQQD